MGVKELNAMVDELVRKANSSIVVNVFEALKKQHIVAANHGENCGCEGCRSIENYRIAVLRVWRKKKRLLSEELCGNYPITFKQAETIIDINELRIMLTACGEERKALKREKNFEINRVL